MCRRSKAQGSTASLLRRRVCSGGFTSPATLRTSLPSRTAISRAEPEALLSAYDVSQHGQRSIRQVWSDEVLAVARRPGYDVRDLCRPDGLAPVQAGLAWISLRPAAVFRAECPAYRLARSPGVLPPQRRTVPAGADMEPGRRVEDRCPAIQAVPA